MDEKKAQELCSRWRMETPSGVTLFPTRAAVEAMTDLGSDMAEADPLLCEAEAAVARGDWSRLAMILARINGVIGEALPALREEEPMNWSEYATRIVNGSGPSGVLSAEEYADRIRATWMGKCIGTALGDPIEGWTRQRIAREYGIVRSYLAEPKVENDDTAYPILVLHALDEYGPEFTSRDLSLEWVGHLPFAYTAEWSALENLKAGLFPPESRWAGNPCGAWVGGQMRTEIHGLLFPLEPSHAGELAFRDAVISHYREGLEGAVYAAALISLAFAHPGAGDLLRQALAYVPSGGRFAETVERTMDLCYRRGEWSGVMEELGPELDRYHWIHTLPNIAAVVVGLMLGEGEFERALLTTLRCGYDTDCSAGQTGALMGCLLGTRGIPDAWREPIGPALQSYVDGFEEIAFDDLVAWTKRWGLQLAPHRVISHEPSHDRKPRQEGA
jgi:ADP-ribosylglycohydrolase